VLVIAAIVGIAGFRRYRSQQADQARSAFQEAMNLYHGKLETSEPQFGVITFATNIEKNARVTEALEGVAADFPNRFEGWAARYYLAMHQIEQGNTEEGQKQLEAVTQGGDEEIASLARLALAHLLKTQGKNDEARQIYQYLVDHPTDLVAKPRSQLLLAEMLIESDPQQARTLLESLQTMPGAISVAAVSLLPRLPPAPVAPAEAAAPQAPEVLSRAWPSAWRPAPKKQDAIAASLSREPEPRTALSRAAPRLPGPVSARPRPHHSCPRVPPAGAQDPGLHLAAFGPLSQSSHPHH
jgi:predicted negative regulator of RcsB-dependent stress response